MIFVGDISLPYMNAIELKGLPERLQKSTWFGNLEGAIIDHPEEEQKKTVVFNDRMAITELLRRFRYAGFALANNHILDTGSFEETTNFLSQNNLSFGGAGIGKQRANEIISIEEGDQKVIIMNFGWEVIQCDITSSDKKGVNPLEKRHVLTSFQKIREEHPNDIIIVFFHWNYELEAYPQPFERELAKELIRKGASGIIGCHPHRVGGVEFYKEAPIVYSLGNWLFLQNYYYNGRIKFPDLCNLELAFEWNFKDKEFLFHFFEYNRKERTLCYLKTESYSKDRPIIDQHTPFGNLSDEQYKVWYRSNRYHKGKGLPIYYWEDSPWRVKAKNYFNKLRDFLIMIRVNMKR